MAYADFTLSSLVKKFDLKRDESHDLFVNVPDVPLRPAFQEQISKFLPLALALSTEKARSELIIAPVLLELWLMTGQRIGFFSGVDFTVDQAAGLGGFCDYILTRSTEQMFIEAPVVMLVEAKNEDMKRGCAQCIAEMIAAQRFNAAEGREIEAVYGVVTTGELWKFLELTGTTVRIDIRNYHIERVAKIMSILLHLAGLAPVNS